MNNKDLPAFPDPQRGSEQSYSNQSPWDSPTGLTKREYLATMMMQGLLASWGQHDCGTYEELANDAVLAADLLLTELSKK